VGLLASRNLFSVDPNALRPVYFTFERSLQILFNVVDFYLVVEIPFKENLVAEPSLNVLIHRVHCLNRFFTRCTFLDRLPHRPRHLKLNWLDLLELGVPVLVIRIIS